uniref:Putative lipopolysaccharide biosynthesis n=1 Tax=Magnetococcus massalia (strain MO-1) TaxID=451514 RepID=A0A1S7LMH7_MAGMO|nr:Putative lipopolysaccharide biosynthesis [Candidatus Magnetococcus massalia]
MQEFGVRELNYQMFTHLRGMWRHRWHFIVVAWFVCIVGWGSVFMMEDQYISRAKVVIQNPRGDLNPYLKKISKVRIDVTREARRILNGLMRAKNLERVARTTELWNGVTNQQSLEEVIADLRSQVTVMPSRNKKSYVIAHRYSDPEITKQVVDAMLKILMEHSIEGVKNKQISSAKQFFAEQVNEYEAKMAEAELALQNFKRQNPSVRPDAQGDYYSRLAEFKKRVEDEELKVKALEKERDALAQQLADRQRPRRIKKSSNPLVNPLMDEDLDRRIERLEEHIREMLDTHYLIGGEKRYLYDEAHPEIRALRNQMLDLQRQKQEAAEQLRNLNDQQMPDDLPPDPVTQQTLIDLRKVEVDLASGQTRLEEFRQQLYLLRNQETTIPAREAEFLRLKRNRDIYREQLENLLSNQGEAQFSGDVAEGLSKKVRIKIVSKPRLPYAPEGPNRPLFITVAMVGGLLAGLSMALFMSIMRPVFDSPNTLKKELGLPVLGTVSHVQESPIAGPIGARTMFVLGLLIMLLAYGIIMYVVS